MNEPVIGRTPAQLRPFLLLTLSQFENRRVTAQTRGSAAGVLAVVVPAGQPCYEPAPMGLLLRLVAAVLRGFLLPPLRTLGPVDVHFRVWPFEAGFKLLFSERYLGYTEAARTEMMIRAGFLAVARRNAWTPVIASELVRFKKPVYRFQRVRLSTRVLGWDDRFMYFEHTFFRGETLVALVLARGTILSARGPVPPARFVAELPWLSSTSPPLPESVGHWARAEDSAFTDATAASAGAPSRTTGPA